MAKSKLNKAKPKLKFSDSGSTTNKATVKPSKAKTSGGSINKNKTSAPQNESGSTTRRSLDPAREKLNVLTTEANRRYHELQSKGITSRALFEADRTLTKSHREKYYEPNDELFTSNLKSTREINRELSRTLAFLNDPTSLTSGSEIYEQRLGEGLFGAQYRKNGGPGYNEDVVDEFDAQMVFDIYHRILEEGGGWEMVVGWFQLMNPGLVEFGSENIINSIYDMVSNRNKITLSEGIEDVSGEIMKRTLKLIDEMKSVYGNLAKLQLSGNDYGSILSDKEIQTNQAYISYIMSQNKNKKKG